MAGPRTVPDATGGKTAASPADIARAALRRVAAGVAVLTVRHDGLRHGATVSAMVAISRDPLLLGVALHTSSLFTALSEKAGCFSVNVLDRSQDSVAVHFADPRRPTGDAQFSGFGWSTDLDTGAPLIDGCVAHLACRLKERHRIGDHDLIVAEVVAGRYEPGEPLLSYSGRLHPTLAVSAPVKPKPVNT